MAQSGELIDVIKTCASGEKLERVERTSELTSLVAGGQNSGGKSLSSRFLEQGAITRSSPPSPKDSTSAVIS